MKKYISLLIILLQLQVSAQSKYIKTSTGRPKLVVGIVIDQMRWDYLYRYKSRYGEGGFKRLLSEGFSCENAYIDHLPSYTAVGHSTIYTGSVPAIHGITGNQWIDQLSGKSIYCTDDSTVRTVGSKSNTGKMSPRNLLVSTITDELRLATNFQSKVVGVSLKDRAAILPAGHTANAAFWMDDTTGSFITSTYYMADLPPWVNDFNSKNIPGQLVENGWNTLYPLHTYIQSSADDVFWEGTFQGEGHPIFPHHIAEYYKKDHSVIRSTPYGNTLTLKFAKAAIEGYKLGKNTTTDFLTINCASTDYVGHMYGPNSIEVEDTYLRLDKDLEMFLNYLDTNLGKGNYLVFLTADHGAANTIDYLKQNKIPSNILDMPKLMKQLDVILDKALGVNGLIISGLNYHVNYNQSKIDETRLDIDAVKKISVDFLRKQPGVMYAVDIDKIGMAPIAEPIKTMIINGYNFKRSGPVMILPDAGWYDFKSKGTTHGNWNPYDTHIPLIFMGYGIQKGRSNKLVYMHDIAATIAALLHIQVPNGSIGKPITAVIEDRATILSTY